MKRERIDINAGDLIRCPDRVTARWHKVVRVGRRRDGTRYVVIRRSRIWPAFGLAAKEQVEWAQLKALGYALKRAKAAIRPAPDAAPRPAEIPPLETV